MSNPTRMLVLVAPPQLGLRDGFASGLVPLANYVSTAVPDVDVRLLDLTTEPVDAIRARLQSICNEAERLWVGITTTTASYQSALRVAAEAKKLRRDASVVFGGHHASPEAENVLRHESVDYVIRGEGEVALDWPGRLRRVRRSGRALRTKPAVPLADLRGGVRW